MDRYFIDSISIEGFRGINNSGVPLVVKFDYNAVNSIYASNGTGKSSIFEAFQYALSGRVESLERLQAGENREDYLANLFHDTRRASISLALVKESNKEILEILVTREPDGTRSVSSPTGHPNPASILEQLNQEYTLLDYRIFSEFIEASALKRGRSFSPLIGLSEYATTRNILERASNSRRLDTDFDIKALEASVAKTQQDIEAIRAAIAVHSATLFGDSEAPPRLDELRGAVIRELEKQLPPKQSTPRTADANIDFDAITDILRQQDNSSLRTTIEELSSSMRRVEAASLKGVNWKGDSEDLTSKIRAVDELSSEDRHVELLSLLEAGIAYFQSDWEPDQHVCPLCGTRHETPISEAIAENTKRLTELKEATAALEVHAQNGALLAHITSLENIDYPESSFNSTQVIGDLDGDAQETQTPTPKKRVKRGKEVQASIDALTDGAPSLEDVRRLTAYAALLDDEKERIYAEIKSQLTSYREQLPPPMADQFETIRVSRTLIEHLDRLGQSSAGLRATKSKLEQYRYWKTFMQNSARKFAELESALSKKVLTSLQSDYQDLFAQINPDRGIVPSLIRDSRKENLSLKLSSFHTASDVTAQAVLSESYRNSLAISIFLSAAMKRSLAPRFIVLDDVTSSFDAGTQFALLDSIRNTLQYPTNPNGMQFIILSHDTSLEKFFNKISAETDWKHQKLHGIPPFVPLSVSKYASNSLRDNAKTRIQSGDIDGGAGLIRQYFESQLLQVVSKLNIRVPIDISTTDHSRMVGGLLDAIMAEVELHAKAGNIALTAQQQSDLSSRHAPALLANWVSHYSGGGASTFSPHVLLNVLDRIDDLVDCFKYHDPNGDHTFYRSLMRR